MSRTNLHRYAGRRGRRKAGELAQDEHALRWALRCLLRAGGMHEGIGTELQRRHLKRLLGTERSSSALDARADGDEKQLRKCLGERLRELESRPLEPSLAVENAELLGLRLGLSSVERQVLALTICLSSTGVLSECFDHLPTNTFERACTSIARVLGVRLAQVRRALCRRGALRSIPVISYCSSYGTPLELTGTLEHVLAQPIEGEADLLSHFITPTPPPTVSVGDYSHLAAEADLAGRYLRAALRATTQGVNLLLYGPPGTGKTQLAAALCSQIGAELFEVNLEDEDHDVVTGSARLEAYAMSQRMLGGRKNTVFLLDEAEDAFPAEASFRRGAIRMAERQKAWVNRTLESNRIPTIWISNSIHGIDRAYLRRFDLAIQVPQPPRSVRRAVVERHLAGLPLSEARREEIAAVEELSPGHLERAGKVAKLLKRGGRLAGGKAVDLGADIGLVLDQNLRAYSGKRARGGRPRTVVDYEIGLVNASTDLRALRDGLVRSRCGAVCLYGPPGTGKTEFAHHVAKQAGLPLVAKRASELLGCYVGETEQNIAAMFEQAAAEDAVLLLDEADSFLRDRRGAQRSWEVTQVNEMLTQMESFEGIFICSTNLMENLDQASLRRFALKVEFRYMDALKLEYLFARTLSVIGSPCSWQEQLQAKKVHQRLRNVTPGDFAAIARKCKVMGVKPTAMELAKLLTEECGLKEDAARRVGFGG